MKPQHSLNELEREPIVYFGCTWSEIKRCIRRAAAIMAPLTLVMMVAIPGMRVLALVPGLLGWVGLAYLYTQQIRALRVGKPLYYETHQHQVRRPGAAYIRADQVYGTERQASPPKAVGASR